MTPNPPEVRFWAKVAKTGGCWTWTSGTNSKGYGWFYVDGRPVKAHRFAYEMVNGPISEGLQIDHLCRNPGCVRPDHLEAVTPRENTLRGVGISAQNAAKTHCPSGHPYEATNTAMWRGGRYCRTCARDRRRRSRGGAVTCSAVGLTGPCSRRTADPSGVCHFHREERAA